MASIDFLPGAYPAVSARRIIMKDDSLDSFIMATPDPSTEFMAFACEFEADTLNLALRIMR